MTERSGDPAIPTPSPARRHRATLFACDIDLDRVAHVIGIELDRPATPEPPPPPE
jgi:hypothetical protein